MYEISYFKALNGTMSVIFSDILKSQKSHLHRSKPENNGPALLQKSLY